ncbi:MAG: aldo/keto reductase [Chloroflexi bacterium]|nr:aldo/keto reductase [Chloroflexota bacterium]
MIYRELGRTGYRVSQLGFGAMRLPMVGEGEAARVNRELAIPMLHRAFEAGVNYVDTAVGYCNQDSQRAVGEALVGWRDRIVLSTKNHEYNDEKVWWQNLENSLERLRTDYIDIYNHHGINWERYSASVEPKISQWMLKAREQGLIRHICTSFHDSLENLIRIIDTGYVESITLQYNMLDRKLEEGIAYAHEKGLGVVVMGPVAGGRLGTTSPVLEGLLPQVKRVPDLALRFVLSNPNVTLALSGMSTLQQVEENIATASDSVSLSADDQAAIVEHLERLKSMADLYCTGCGYCMPCPHEVNIPHIFQKYNEARVYGLWELARKAYVDWRWVSGKRADACVECGECETKCPQHIPIRDQLVEAHAELSREDSLA